jgi:serine phosphatase RsbU (regulator of sigma subunit)
MTPAKILVVDDEPLNVDYLEQELEGEDLEIITASNGEQALDRVSSDAPDLVLLDIMMPVMDGFEVLSRLKAGAGTRDLPVIVISAASDLQSMVRGIQMGAEDFLPKPFEPTLLRARIGSSLEKKRLRDHEQRYLKGMQRELDIGREIQQGFLPAELPSIKGWEIAAYLKSAREVAGDFYDAISLPGGGLVFVVGDVADKGVGAALFMTLFRSLIRAAITGDMFAGAGEPAALSPAEQLRRAVSFTSNYVAETHFDSNMFATVFIGMLEPGHGRMSYVNCGSEPPLLWRQGQAVEALGPTGPVVGMVPDSSFTVREIEMSENDLLVTFTDGVPDANNAALELFGTDRLRSLLNTSVETPGDLITRIEGELRGFVGNAEQYDDITLLAVKRQ